MLSEKMKSSESHEEPGFVIAESPFQEIGSLVLQLSLLVNKFPQITSFVLFHGTISVAWEIRVLEERATANQYCISAGIDVTTKAQTN